MIGVYAVLGPPPRELSVDDVKFVAGTLGLPVPSAVLLVAPQTSHRGGHFF